MCHRPFPSTLVADEGKNSDTVFNAQLQLLLGQEVLYLRNLPRASASMISANSSRVIVAVPLSNAKASEL